MNKYTVSSEFGNIIIEADIFIITPNYEIVNFLIGEEVVATFNFKYITAILKQKKESQLL